MRLRDYAIIRISWLALVLVANLEAKDDCDWSTTIVTLKPEYQTKSNEQVCVSLQATCGSDVWYPKFVGYTIDWNDASPLLYRGIDLAEKLKNECMSKYSDASKCIEPSEQMYKYPPMRTFSECHNFAKQETHPITINLTTFDNSGPAKYAFSMAGVTKSWSMPPPPPEISPLGYCPIPKGFAIHAKTDLFLNDRVICKGSPLSCKASAGVRGTLGVSAYADQLWTPTTRLRNYARVEQLYATNTDDVQMGASWGSLSAYKAPHTAISVMPSLKTGASSATIEAGKTVPLKAGVYGDYVVRGRGVLRLQGKGPFSFNSLEVESGGILEVMHGDGTTEVYAKSFMFRGLVQNADASRFLVGVVGTGVVYVDHGFTGSIWAPWGQLVLGQSNIQPFQGTYMADRVTFHQKSIIEPVPFVKNQGCAQ